MAGRVGVHPRRRQAQVNVHPTGGRWFTSSAVLAVTPRWRTKVQLVGWRGPEVLRERELRHVFVGSRGRRVRWSLCVSRQRSREMASGSSPSAWRSTLPLRVARSRRPARTRGVSGAVFRGPGGRGRRGADHRSDRRRCLAQLVRAYSARVVLAGVAPSRLRAGSQRGSHVKLRSPSGRTVIVPNHAEIANAP